MPIKSRGQIIYFNRVVIDAWTVVNNAKKSGYAFDPGIIEALKKVTGKDR